MAAKAGQILKRALLGKYSYLKPLLSIQYSCLSLQHKRMIVKYYHIFYKILLNISISTHLCVWRGVLDTTLCDKVCHWLATGQWFSPGTPVSSTNKTESHDISSVKYHKPSPPVSSAWSDLGLQRVIQLNHLWCFLHLFLQTTQCTAIWWI